MTRHTTTRQSSDLVVVDRNGIVENTHQVHAAVVVSSSSSSTGQQQQQQQQLLLYRLGDPSRLTLLRSAAKPAQALAVVETGALERFSFDDADLALMCASHSSEDAHVARARAMLAKAQHDEGQLRCGGHAAISPVVNAAWARSGFAPTAVCNNCSGKHAGMLAGAKAIGVAATDYHLPDHPMQVRVKIVVQELSSLLDDDDDDGGVKWGLDGCNMPAPALPLHSLARIYASFAHAADAAAAPTNNDNSATAAAAAPLPPRTRHMARIFNAMARNPHMVGGEGRFCTRLMEAFGGSIVGKLGADACYAVGIRESEWTRRHAPSGGAIGIAVKIEDGRVDILYAVVAEILEQLQIGTPDMRRPLEAFHRLKIENTMQVVTGQASFPFKLRRV